MNPLKSPLHAGSARLVVLRFAGSSRIRCLVAVSASVLLVVIPALFVPSTAGAAQAATVQQLNPSSDPLAGSCLLPFSSGTGFQGAPAVVHDTVDLSKYDNQAVRLRFYFTTNDSLYNKFEGWYVKNIKVTGNVYNSDGTVARVEPLNDPVQNPDAHFTAQSDFGAAPGWHVTDRRDSFLGGAAWWYGNEATGTYQSPNPFNDCEDSGANAGTITSGVLHLATNSQLSFDTLWEIESINPSSFDLMDVQVIPVGYQPDPDGYSFENKADPNIAYDTMATNYPGSSNEMYWPIIGGHTFEGQAFFDNVYKSQFTGGLCYGFSASSAYLFNDAPYGSLNVYGLFPKLTSPLPFPFDGQGGVPVQTLIERYHSRQLAQVGAYQAAAAYQAATIKGNPGVFDEVSAVVATKPVTLSIVPNAAVLASDPGRWWTLFNESHTVVAYATSTDNMGDKIIDVYNPNSPGDESATVTIDPHGGLTVYDRKEGTTYGGGGSFGGSQEWQAVLQPDFTWEDGSSESVNVNANLFGISGGISQQLDNQHWILDLTGQTNLVFSVGSSQASIPASPLFLAAGASEEAPVHAELIPASQAFSSRIVAGGQGAASGEFSANHVAVATETDPGANGQGHALTIDHGATGLTLSSTSSAQQYTLELAADYLPKYGRKFTVSGVNVMPSSTVEASTNAASDTIMLTGSGAAQKVNLTVAQGGEDQSSASLQALIPGAGVPATVTLADWNNIHDSLVYESYTFAGHTVVLVLQDNASQRLALEHRLIASLRAAIATLADKGVAQSFQAKLQAAERQLGHGNSQAAANTIGALENEVGALGEKKIPAVMATFLLEDAELLGGFLRSE